MRVDGIHVLTAIVLISIVSILCGCTSTSGSSSQATITATPAVTVTPAPTIQQTSTATPGVTATPAPTVQVSRPPAPAEIRPPGDYKIYDPADYDYINWQYAIAAYTKAWYDQDWVEVSKNALPSWRNKVKVTPEEVVKTMLEFKQLKGVEVTGAKTIDDSTVIVSANAWYYDTIFEKDVTQTFTATLTRETAFGEPGKTSGMFIDRFYVDPFIEWDEPRDIS